MQQSQERPDAVRQHLCYTPNILDRMKKGYSMFIVDYKGCETANIKDLAKRADRLKDVVVIGGELDDKVNLIKHMKARDFKQSMQKFMHTNEGFWDSFGANMATDLFQFLYALDNFIKNNKGLSNIKIEKFAKEYPLNLNTLMLLGQNYDKFFNFRNKAKEIFDTMDKFIANTAPYLC